MYRFRGYTVLELIITMVIGTLVIGMVAPAFGDMIRSNNLVDKRNRLFRDLVYSRQNAIDRGRPVVICTSDRASRGCARNPADWDSGWTIFIDRDHDGDCVDADGDTRCDRDNGRILRQWVPESRLALKIRGNNNLSRRVRFQSTGISAGYNGTITFCADRNIRPRGIVVANTGRVRTADPDNLGCPDDG